MQQPGAVASMTPRCGTPPTNATKGAGLVEPEPEREPEPEPEPEPGQPKRGMLTREEAEEMAAATARDIEAAKAEEAAARQQEQEQRKVSAEEDAAALPSALAALEAFAKQQARRVEAYRALEEALRVLLQRGDLWLYQKTCAAITAEFGDCSLRILALAKHLRSRLAGGAESAAIIDAIQAAEERKLHLTVALQLHKSQAPPQLLDILAKPNESDHADPEKDAELEGKMKELKQQIAGVVDEINEQLEALRYEKADLMECDDAA